MICISWTTDILDFSPFPGPGCLDVSWGEREAKRSQALNWKIPNSSQTFIFTCEKALEGALYEIIIFKVLFLLSLYFVKQVLKPSNSLQVAIWRPSMSV